MCPLGLWLHRVSLLSWGSAGWTPPSRMPSSSWDYIQLPAPTLRAGTCPPPRALAGNLQGTFRPHLSQLPTWVLLYLAAPPLASPHPPALLARSDLCALPCAPFSGFRTLCVSAVHSLLNMMVSSLSPHLWLPACCPAHLSPVCLFPVSPSARRPSPSG